MARFASEAELETFLGRLDPDYGRPRSSWGHCSNTCQRHKQEQGLRCHRSKCTAQLGSSRHILPIGLATMYANYWSLLSPLCRWLLTFQKRQDDDMKYYLAPLSQSGAVAFSSTIHAVLRKKFPAGSDMVQAGQLDQLVCDIMDLLDEYAQKLHLKRKRNEGEVSPTLSAKRPDLCVLVRGALLFKGEDKTEEGQLDQAVVELKQKMRRWSHSYQGQVEFLLCYAMAGGWVRICMLRRDDPDSCHVLSGDHSIYDMRGRLHLVRIAILLYRILAIQQTKLPSDAVPLASVLEFSSGTKITVMEDYVIKRVDIEKQPLLVERLAELQKLYKATRGSKHLIGSEEGPHIHKKYTVILSPFGEQLGPGYLSFRIPSLAQLQAAIRCILLALRGLHAANFAHTDIRWPTS
ncbi:hypothetical protein ABBQ38_006067 [Trebouxia sp. C0009 RCD-2024]